MMNKRIALQADAEAKHVKSLKRRRIYFALGGLAILMQLMLIIRWLLSASVPAWNGLNAIPYSLGLWLGIIFIYRGVMAMRKDQELFVSFEEKQITYRSQPGAKVKHIALHELESVEMHTLRVYLHEKSGQQHELSWEEADYDAIQHVKACLLEVKKALGQDTSQEEKNL